MENATQNKKAHYKTAFTSNNECVGLSCYNEANDTFTIQFISGEQMDNVPAEHLADFCL